MVGVAVGQRVDVLVAVPVWVGVREGVAVRDGVGVIVGWGGFPVTLKKPVTFHSVPTKI